MSDISTILSILAKNTQETIGLDDLKPLLDERKTLNLYWGTSPTRIPSVTYLLPLIKLRDCVKAGLNVTIFLADLHSSMEKGFDKTIRVSERTDFYEFLIKEIMMLLGVQPDEYKIVRGSNVQLSPTYMMNLLKFSSLITTNDAKQAGKEVVNQALPRLSGLIYPLMQCLDEQILDAHIQLGGIDQRRIFSLGREYMPKLGFRACTYLMIPVIPSLVKGDKLSSSNPKSKIEFLDDIDEIREKIGESFCCERDKNLGINPCLSILKNIIFPMKQKIGDLEKYSDFEEKWVNGTICSQQLKEIVVKNINEIMDPIRQKLLVDGTGKKLYDLAYKGTNERLG